MNVRMANWMAGVVLPISVVAGCLVDGVTSSHARNVFETAITLVRSGDAGVERHAAVTGAGEGVPFGYRFTYELSDGRDVACIARFSRFSCDGGWELDPATGETAWTGPSPDFYETLA